MGHYNCQEAAGYSLGDGGWKLSWITVVEEVPSHPKDLQGPAGPRREGIGLQSALEGARGCAALGRRAGKV